MVEGAFPEPDDALHLKQDIVDGRFAPAVQLDILAAIVRDKNKHPLPRPSPEGMGSLARFWPSHEQELMALAEEAATKADLDALVLLQAITQAIPIDRFWPLTSNTPHVRRMMVEARPNLLLSPGVENVDAATISASPRDRLDEELGHGTQTSSCCGIYLHYQPVRPWKLRQT